jgi:hypothetical protein
MHHTIFFVNCEERQRAKILCVCVGANVCPIWGWVAYNKRVYLHLVSAFFLAARQLHAVGALTQICCYCRKR